MGQRLSILSLREDRQNFVSIRHHAFLSSNDAMVSANNSGTPAQRRNEREEENFPSWHSELSEDWYEDDSDDSDSDWDSDSDCDCDYCNYWDYRGPSQNYRRERYPYPNDRGRGGRYDDYPEPSTHHSRRTSTFPRDYDYGHSHAHNDYPDPSRHHSRRSNSFATDYDRRYDRDDYFHPRSSRRPNPHPAPYDRSHGHRDHGYPPRSTHHHGHRPAPNPTYPPHGPPHSSHHHRQPFTPPGSPFLPRPHGHRDQPFPYDPSNTNVALTTRPRPRRRGRLTRKILGMIRSFVRSWT